MTVPIAITLLAVVLLAFANGANDNFKGVATLYGSGTTSYRRALIWATVTTLAGSLLAPLVAAGLIRTFQAKGLVPASIAAFPEFLAAAAAGAAITVLAATRLGLPVSTTHALTGGLAGAGLVAAGGAVRLDVLATSFILPLALAPFVAIALAVATYAIAHRLRMALRIRSDDCVCVGAEWIPVASLGGRAGAATAVRAITATAASPEQCVRRYGGSMFGARVQTIVDAVHFASAGAVSFARGLNDAPKILALLLAAQAFGAGALSPLALVAIAMAAGGVLAARRVARTISKDLSTIEPGPGTVVNLNTALLVISGSIFKLPLSTTHVSSGGIVGIGLVNGSIRWRLLARIGLAWVTTLPLGAALGAGVYALFTLG